RVRRLRLAHGPLQTFGWCQPRPTNGILVAMIVMNCTFTSGGMFAMKSTACPQYSTGMRGSGFTSPFAWRTPCAMRLVNGGPGLRRSIWQQAMSYFRPPRESVLVRPVAACLVAVYGAESGRGACAEIEPLLMMRPPRGFWLFMILNASCAQKNMPF